MLYTFPAEQKKTFMYSLKMQ